MALKNYKTCLEMILCIFFFTLFPSLYIEGILEPILWAIYSKCLGPYARTFWQQCLPHSPWIRQMWLPVTWMKTCLLLFIYPRCPLGFCTPTWRGSVQIENDQLVSFFNSKFKLILKWCIRLYLCVYTGSNFSCTFLFISSSTSHCLIYDIMNQNKIISSIQAKIIFYFLQCNVSMA